MELLKKKELLYHRRYRVATDETPSVVSRTIHGFTEYMFHQRYMTPWRKRTFVSRMVQCIATKVINKTNTFVGKILSFFCVHL
jgi:hypothetical protein